MKKILLVSTNALGDTFLSLAALRPLRAAYGGDCIIDMVMTRSSGDLAEAVPLDSTIVLENRRVPGILSALRRVRRQRYDAVFSFFPGRINTIFLRCSDADQRIGFSTILPVLNWWIRGSETVYSNSPSRHRLSWNAGQPYLDRIAVCLSAADLEPMTLEKPVLFEQDTEVPPEKDYILIHPRSTQKERSISLTALDVLIRSLLERQERSIVIPGWGEDGRTLEESFRGRPKVVIKKDLPLRMTVRYIKHASLCIAVESFLLHITDAVDRNFIGVFGPSDPRAALVHQSKAVRLPTKDLSSVDGAILTDVVAGRLQENGW